MCRVSGKGMGMWTTQRSLIFLAVMLGLSPAWAENAVLDSLPVLVASGEPDGAPANDVNPDRGTSAASGKDGSQLPLPGVGRDHRAREGAGGLQWSHDGQRPALVYRFSEDGVLRFRGRSRGIEFSASWDF